MRKNTKKAVCIFFAVLLLVCSFPISAFAVDPISASAIANGFAQAITAYGASHGVSMTFDGINSGNTDQIGQSVHELWSRFRAGQQTADDYDTIAAAVFPGLYNKVIKAGGTAVVGLSIAQEYMEDIDGFWNWLLSGPAEMVKVDNAYQWNSVNGEIAPVTVYSYDSLAIPYVSNVAADSTTYSESLKIYRYNYNTAQKPRYRTHGLVSSTGGNCGAFLYTNGSILYLGLIALSSGQIVREVYYDEYQNNYVLMSSPLQMTVARQTNEGATYYVPSSHQSWGYPNNNSWYLPIYPSEDAGIAAFLGGYGLTQLKVQPYVGDAVARPVPIPDTDDPDYGPLPWVGDLDLPWNDTLFGDGTGTLTDAQKEAISGALDQAIEDDGTLVLEGDEATDNPGTDTDDPPSSDPDDYGVIGLENVFPFCIPFDIYNFLSALAATPTAPHFTATLQLPSALGGAQTIDLDFDNPTFNQLAQLLRLLELLAFIVGLALLTRSMFIRG